jgi:hypothetical protein
MYVATLRKLVDECLYAVDPAAVAEAMLASPKACRLLFEGDFIGDARSRAARAARPAHRRTLRPAGAQD